MHGQAWAAEPEQAGAGPHRYVTEDPAGRSNRMRGKGNVRVRVVL
jgi:hypothetical protein